MNYQKSGMLYFYLIKTGCQWRMLPKEYPKWELVYYYYRKWSSMEGYDLLLSKLRESVRLKRGQKASASLGVIDSQTYVGVIISPSMELMEIKK
ncbi:MAG: transposase [Tannerellaceae bacterium]|jgi:transposase|nr:transposase [Tannerellaceae bacterium]